MSTLDRRQFFAASGVAVAAAALPEAEPLAAAECCQAPCAIFSDDFACDDYESWNVYLNDDLVGTARLGKWNTLTLQQPITVNYNSLTLRLSKPPAPHS